MPAIRSVSLAMILIALIGGVARGHEVFPDHIRLLFNPTRPPIQMTGCEGWQVWVNGTEIDIGRCVVADDVWLELRELTQVIDATADTVEVAYTTDHQEITDSARIGGTENQPLLDIPRQVVHGDDPPPPPDENEPPTAAITNPRQGDTVKRGSQVSVRVTAADPDGSVANVRVTVTDGGQVRTVCTTTATPYVCPWTVPTGKRRTFTLHAYATDNDGTEGEPAHVAVHSQ